MRFLSIDTKYKTDKFPKSDVDKNVPTMTVNINVNKEYIYCSIGSIQRW